ncbi:MAG: hypothetical protein B6D54_05835 [Epsilonproteobacteria bacterium 4484_65]|nr:MAG: hypothetical protein B6D54_05835 [Epsilonproteobacteria bacterium 4484_65]HEC45377.1 hypothetical protein [Campylobacterota bacterium]
MRKIIAGTLLTYTLATAGGDIAETVEEPVIVEESSAWEHKVAIYGWAASFDGTLTYSIPGEDDVESDGGVVDKLDGMFMGAYELRKDKFSFLADVLYLGMSGGETIAEDIGRGRLATTVTEEFDAWILSFYGGYNVIDTGSATLDIIAGMRYFSLDVEASIDLPVLAPIPLSPSFEAYDALIGVKGSFDINENWYVPYIFDIGAGDSDLTWQAQASIGYRFGWGDVLATYRYIHYEVDAVKLVEDFDLYGPKVGVVFHF